MAKITKFDPSTCRMVGERVSAALKTLADELGVVIKTRGGKYTAGSFECKLEIATIADDGTVMTREANAFAQLATLYGFQKTDLGRSFRNGGRTFTLVGIAPRSRKRPVIGRETNGGREYGFTAEDVLRSLKAQDAGER